ncbi:thrombospondin type-1 domain-containing protein [Thalassobaculum sp. OXR-137]|uniref:thrombospondin type-1 domain-containing protein n=1 Tax=Thalassobaculum sp. OXR-137 TaxID=3100173 RepID=UPI002AC98B44|nr:thrombospondin type-1 domain-containing protein [Thalassobaculum sp. OXR-137]WPZ34093.1 thrombospondin type-1 domain-containing protein [Thalassobaculum sp. OXR-137]
MNRKRNFWYSIIGGCLTALGLIAAPQFDGSAQNKFFATPNRGIDGAKGNAQIKMLMDENALRRAETVANAGSITTLGATLDASLTSLGDCGSQGMMFGGDHPNSDAQDCLPDLRIEDDGKVTLSGGVQLGDYAVCNATSEGTLRYVSSQKTVLLCDGASWIELGAAPAAGGAFNAVTNAALSTSVTSNGIGLSGFFGTRTATATNGATIIVNGTSQGSSADVKAGDTIALRMTSLGTYGATRSTTFSVSSLSTGWSVTTGTVNYSPWGSWDACSSSCGGGTQTRSRSCNFSGGGSVNCADCGGDCSQSQSCNTQTCCPCGSVDGVCVFCWGQ